MPYVKKAVAEQVVLPSDSNYWVMWRPKLTYGQMRDIARAGQVMENGEVKMDNLTATDTLLLAHIESWNLTDEQDALLPLTAASLALLDEDDVAHLTKLATTQAVSEDQERKS